MVQFAGEKLGTAEITALPQEYLDLESVSCLSFSSFSVLFLNEAFFLFFLFLFFLNLSVLTA